MRTKMVLFISALVVSMFFNSCTSPTSSSSKLSITFTNVYWTDATDEDSDGYVSYAKLNFETTANKSDVDIVVKVGVRFTTNSDTATYYLYFQSTSYGTVKKDAKYVEVGLPNQELDQGCYDFIIQIFEKDKPDHVVAEANLKDFNTLTNVCFESKDDDTLKPFTLTFNNPLYTDIEVTVTGKGKKTVPVGGSANFQFDNNPGTISFYAQTSGKTTQGTQVGLLMSWTYSDLDVSGFESKSYDLVLTSAYFFLYMRNNGGANLNPLYVNYGLSDQTMDNIVIPNDNVKYRIGYYKAYKNTEVRAYFENSSSGVQWIQGTHFSFPWTNNQSIELLNTLSPGDAGTINIGKLSKFSDMAKSLIPADKRSVTAFPESESLAETGAK